MIKLKKQIEFAKFRCKLLSQERDKKSVLIRQFKQKLTNCVDENEEKREKSAIFIRIIEINIYIIFRIESNGKLSSVE